MSEPPGRWCGYLLKQHLSSKTWQTRYCVLENGIFFYYKHRGDVYPKGIVILSNCVIAQTPQYRHFSFSTAHSMSTTKLHFASSESANLLEWMGKLQVHSRVPPVPSPRTSLLVKDLSIRAVEVPKLWSESNIPVSGKYEYQIKSMMTDFAQHLFDQVKWHKKDALIPIFTATSSGAVMSKITINRSPPVVLEALLNNQTILSVDYQCEQLQTLSSIDPHTSVQYALFKPIFPFPKRQFVKLVHWRLLPDNSLIWISRSLQNYTLPASLSLIENVERCPLNLEGYHIVPSQDNLCAEVTYLLQTSSQSTSTDIISALSLKIEQFGIHLESKSVTEEMKPKAFPVPTIALEYATELETAVTTLLSTLGNANAFTFHGEKNGVRVSSKADGNLLEVLGRGTLPFQAKTFVDFILDIDEKMSYDPLCLLAKHHVRFDANTTIDYCEYKPILMVSGRDFLTLVHSRELNDGSILIVVKSTTHPTCPTKEPDIIRGHVHLAGWHVIPQGEVSDVTFFVKTDLKGYIPTRISQRVLLEQGFSMLDIVSALQKRLSESPSKSPAIHPMLTNPIDVVKPEQKTNNNPLIQQDLTLTMLAIYMAIFLIVLYVLPAIQMSTILDTLHDSMVWLIVLYFGIQVYLGPSIESPQLKLQRVASGVVQVGIDIDVSKSIPLMNDPKNSKATHSHLVVWAVAQLLKQFPTLNGHLVFGNFYPSPSVDLSYLRRGGNLDELVTLRSCDKATIATLVHECKKIPIHLHQRHLALASYLPTWCLQLGLHLCGWLSQCLGIDCSIAGFPPNALGHALVHEQVDNDITYATIPAWMNLALIVTFDKPHPKVCVENDKVIVRSNLHVNLTVDTRYMPLTDLNQVTQFLSERISNPSLHDKNFVD
ncbi:hypothetical protein THRCLA_05311 [Thraustotheca clavata]|uniref:PH domain-containing protein n=1 Tax=Thraustotheca clavata TaxID=74557 RepID=A0A1V9ZWC3_9STRA|nr:hypothetical protein THRCLA_05311 [Thraustotheca clavata]